jgi:hypothetical protein
MFVMYHVLSDSGEDLRTHEFLVAISEFMRRDDSGKQIWKEIYEDGVNPDEVVADKEVLVIDAQGHNVEHLGICEAIEKKSYILYGDITHAGRVRVQACGKDVAIARAENGDFEIVEEAQKGLGFIFDGSDEHIEEE